LYPAFRSAGVSGRTRTTTEMLTLASVSEPEIDDLAPVSDPTDDRSSSIIALVLPAEQKVADKVV